MLNEATVTQMNVLKLFGMARSFVERLANKAYSGMTHAEFVGLLVNDEKTDRENRRLKRLLANARLREQAALEDINYRHARGLNKQVMMELSSSQWISSGRDVIITGPTGLGKTYIACALGNQAARAGYTVQYFRAPRMFEYLMQSRGDGSHLKALNKLGRNQMLIIDDFLLTPTMEQERKDFLEVIEERHGQLSTVITSQCPPKEWHQNIGDDTIADAICDRLLHTAYKIELKGDSIRKNKRIAAEKGS